MSVSLNNAFIIDVLSAVATSLWFRKQEPRSYRLIFAVLATAPAPSAFLLLSGYSYSWISIFLAYLFFLVSLLVNTGAYRISPFHPLTKYPGPLLCKLSKLWAVRVAHEGKAHVYYHKLHQKYGPIVRIGPNEISVIETDLIPFILGTQGMPKGPLWDGRLVLSSEKTRMDSLIGCRDLQRHAQLRKPWNKSFSFEPMKGYEELLLSRGAQLVDSLSNICKSNSAEVGDVDIAKWISYFSFDFMGDMAFGGGFELMRDGDKDEVWHSMEKSIILPNIAMHIPWIVPAAQTLPLGLTAYTRKFSDFCIKQVFRRKSATNFKQKDLYYYLITSMEQDSEEASYFPIVASNAVLTVVAGSDTTASVLCNIIYYLICNPEYYTRLQAELDQEFSPTSLVPIDVDKLLELKLLNAVINETLRLQPAVPTALQRAPAKSSGGKAMGPVFIPEGTSVLVPPYVLHRDRRYFSPDPEKFWPERWMKEDDSIILDRAAFIPFSYGPAICAGKALAMLELRIIVAMLVQKFDMTFSDGYERARWEKDLMDRLVFCKGDLPVKLKIRKF